MTNANTAADSTLDVRATYDQVEAIAAMLFNEETCGQTLTRLIGAAKEAKIAADAAAEALAAIRQEILETMVAADLSTVQTPSGDARVCKGRRTVSVTDKALAAEITAIKERGVHTGRCAEKIGDPYITIK